MQASVGCADLGRPGPLIRTRQAAGLLKNYGVAISIVMDKLWHSYIASRKLRKWYAFQSELVRDGYPDFEPVSLLENGVAI